MSEDDLKRIRRKKAEMLLKLQSMPKEIINIKSRDEFSKLLNDHPDKIIIVDFWATWCTPCMTFAPVFEKLQKEYPEFIFIKVNVDENSQIAREYKVSAIPMTFFIKNGRIINKNVGALNYISMKQLLEKFKS